MKRFWWGLLLLPLMVGCGRQVSSEVSKETPPARPAAAFQAILGPLRSRVRIPVLLPGWVPPPVPGEMPEYYLLQYVAGSNSYSVSFDFTNKKVPPNPPPDAGATTSMSGTLGSIEGGPVGSLRFDYGDTVQGGSYSVVLGQRVTGRFYPANQAWYGTRVVGAMWYEISVRPITLRPPFYL